jgi:hypothetical protein
VHQLERQQKDEESEENTKDEEKKQKQQTEEEKDNAVEDWRRNLVWTCRRTTGTARCKVQVFDEHHWLPNH